MKVNQRERGGVTILDLAGKVTIGEVELALRNAVRDALNGGARAILLNLERVSAMDSSGVGELVSAYTTVANRGGTLKLAVLPPRIRDVMLAAQALTVFEVFDDEASALASFS